MLNLSAIIPHPTALIPELKNEQISQFKKTTKSLALLKKELAKEKPKTIILISPHGSMRYDKFTINLENRLQGSFSAFGSEAEEMNFSGNSELAKQIFTICRSLHLPIDLIREPNLDYASLLSLYYLLDQSEETPAIIPVTYTAFDYQMHYIFGKAIGKAIAGINEPVVILASGDLSHRLTKDAPAGFSPYGKKFDETLIDLLENNQVEKILGLNPDFADEAQECALRSVIIALGSMFNQKKIAFRKLSYEAPLGVGHLVGYWKFN
ncbi:MAG TPA: hypothetical protein GX706_03160 [Candidatus Moranbacteria bacterium]|nr:hypothetical protein [Candidatus Moranbacteria bacterium]